MPAADPHHQRTWSRRRTGRGRRRVLVVAGLCIAGVGVVAALLPTLGDDELETLLEVPVSEPEPNGIWISADEIAQLPIDGPAWAHVEAYAMDDWGKARIKDQNSDHDVHTLAGALYAVRVDDADMREKVVEALEDVTGKRSKELLALSRNLLSYVVAADVIGYRTEEFESWLEESLDRRGEGRAGIENLYDSALRDPTNHGAHARASVIAAAQYLGDSETVQRIASRFHDWLGRSDTGFVWRELDWQADPDQRYGINPPGAEIDGADVDGVLPEEQRRSGRFKDPAPQESYVWEGLQGVVATAELLHRAGYAVWEWEDQAIRRAFVWLYDVNEYPAEGDDRWIPWLINARYGMDLPTESPSQPGKNIGFTDWTHSR